MTVFRARPRAGWLKELQSKLLVGGENLLDDGRLTDHDLVDLSANTLKGLGGGLEVNGFMGRDLGLGHFLIVHSAPG